MAPSAALSSGGAPEASAAHGPSLTPVGLPWEEQRAVIALGRERLRDAISWRSAVMDGGHRVVAVAEEEIDWAHPALSGVRVFLDADAAADPVPVPAVVPAPVARVGEPPATRARNGAKDHGTMVASLIAATWSPFDDGVGLARSAKVLALSDRPNVLAGQIATAKRSGVRVFNISRSVPSAEGAYLQQVMEDPRNEGLLFVVAAGNDGLPLRQADRVPALWGDRPNIVVVAATSEDGSRLVSSNYDPERVTLAAPGYGYYAAGEGYAYVPADGTSFATALVTAVAVQLSRAGLSPRRVKERLMATATFHPALASKVRAGTLNADLALSGPWEDWVETDNDGPAPFAPVLSHALHFTTPSYDPGPLLLEELRRLSRNPDGRYRVAYVKGLDQELEWLDDAVIDPGAELPSQAGGPPIALIDVRHWIRRTEP